MTDRARETQEERGCARLGIDKPLLRRKVLRRNDMYTEDRMYEKLGTNSRWLASANEHFEKDLLGVVLWSGAFGWYTVIEFVFFLRYGAWHTPSPRRRYVFKK